MLGKLFASVLDNRLQSWAEPFVLRRQALKQIVEQLTVSLPCLHLKAAKGKTEKTMHASFISGRRLTLYHGPHRWWPSMAGATRDMRDTQDAKLPTVHVCNRQRMGLQRRRPHRHRPSTMRMKQGFPLSPLLFGIYLDFQNGLQNFLKILEAAESLDAPCPNGKTVPVLLYADDLSLLSHSREKLQKY